jgi:hypothetical protein
VTAPLPSQAAADAFVASPSLTTAIPVVASTALRGALVAGGLYALGLRGKKLAESALTGAGAIEAFVLGWSWWHK